MSVSGSVSSGLGGPLTPHSDSSPWFLTEYKILPSAKLGFSPSDEGTLLLEFPEEKITQDKEIQDLFFLYKGCLANLLKREVRGLSLKFCLGLPGLTEGWSRPQRSLSSEVTVFLVYMGGTPRNHGIQRKASVRTYKGPIWKGVIAMKGGEQTHLQILLRHCYRGSKYTSQSVPEWSLHHYLQK